MVSGRKQPSTITTAISKIEDLAGALSDIKEAVADIPVIKSNVEDLKRAVFKGNGRPGLVDRVTICEEQNKTLFTNQKSTSGNTKFVVTPGCFNRFRAHLYDCAYIPYNKGGY